MPGLGKYKKGAKFTLKSGNKPAFKMIAGESPITSPANMNSFGVGKGTSPYKAVDKAKLGAAGRNLAEIFMGGIHNVYGNPSKTTKTSEFDEEKAYKRWAKEKSDKETMTLAQQIIADDKKKSQIKKA